MFKIIHTLINRFRLVVDSIFFLLYDCLYSMYSYRCPQSSYTFPVGVCSILWQKAQSGLSWLVSWPSFGPLSPAKNFNGIQVRTARMPLQHADIILLKRFLTFSGMFWIAVLLELPMIAELELLCRFLQVCIKDLDVILLSHVFLNPDGLPCATAREAAF